MKKEHIENLKLISLPAGLVLLSFLSFLVVRADYIEHERIPASAASENTMPDYAKLLEKTSVEKSLKKPHGAVEVEISSPNVSTLSSGQTTELEGQITVNRDVDAVDVVWHLPSGIEMISGSLTQTLSKMTAGETRRVTITVTSHSNLNQQIHLEASYLQGGEKNGNTSQFNTLDQKKLNVSGQNLGQNEGAKIWQ